MADTILSAEMSDQELLQSINKTLGKAEERFDTFINDINTKLKSIGGTATGGKSAGSNINVDNVINLDQLDSAVKSSKDFSTGMDKATNSAKKMKKELSELGQAKQSTAEEKVNLELLKRQALLEKERTIRARITNESQRASKAESLGKIAIGGQSFDSAMGMSSNSIQERIEKIKALQNVQKNLSTTESSYSSKLASTNREISNLKKANQEALTSGIALEKHNNKLISSFENLGKRVIFYAGLGAITGFVTQVYAIRGEYEMLERSMGALLGDFAKGSELFNKIKAQALKSPFTVIDLENAAKQLIAYNFEMSTVSDTTRRLGDVSSALGVPMERLVYNLGQVKAQGVLTARDARDFANAGLAIVPMLAQLYTSQKRFGDQMVTTADVYDMMSKKMVSYQDVMSVVNKITNDGGMFFNFQAKQAETLKGQLSNTVDAWNMMLNEIGQENQGVMTGIISLARTLFSSWRLLNNAILVSIPVWGAYKATQLVINSLMGQTNNAIKSNILATKAKRAADLEQIGLTRKLTPMERNFINTRKEATAADYAAAFSAKRLNREQALLLVAFNKKNKALQEGLVISETLTQTEVTATLGMSRWKLVTMSLKNAFTSLTSSIWSFVKANAVMLAITGATILITSLITKSEEHKQKLKDINDEYINLRKNISDISVNFQVAIKKKDTDEAKAKLDELINLAKTEYNIKINIDTSKLEPKEIVKTFNNIKSQIEDLTIFSNMFAKSVAETDLNDKMQKVGTSAETFYGVIINENSAVISALQAYINKLKSTGAAQSAYAKEQAALNQLLEPKGKNEAQLHYLERIADVYYRLGLLGKDLQFTDEFAKRWQQLGVMGGETFQSLITSARDFYGAQKTASESFGDQVDELAKSINLDAIPIEKRTLKLEAAINKYASDNNLNEWSRETMLRFANEKYKTNISFVIDANAQDEAKKEVRGWVLGAQAWLDEHPLKAKTKLSITEDKTPSEAASEAYQNYEKAKADYETLLRQPNKAKLIGSGIGTLQGAKDAMDDARRVAVALGAAFPKEAKAATKAVKESLSEQANAFKNEIELIGNLTSNYKKLTDVGYSSVSAIKILTKEYKNSIGSINKVFGKYGIAKFDIGDFAGKNTSEILKMLEKQRALLPKNAKADVKQTLDVEIAKTRIESKTFDLSLITDGLQEQLNNIKESYELGIEIEQNPELGELFTNIFKIDPNSIIRTAEDAINTLQNVWSEKVKAYNELNPSTQINVTDILSTKPTDLAKTLGLQNSSEIIQQYKAFYEYAKKIREDDYKNTVKSWNDILSKYSENEYKKIEIQKTAAKERLTVIQKFGEAEEYKQALDLNNQIQISDDPKVIKDLQDKLSNIIDKISKRNPVAIPIATAITGKSNRETAAIDFEQFKNSDLYIKAFEDLSRVGNATLDELYQKLLKFSKDPNLDFAQLREIMRQMKSVRDQIGANDPFKQVTDGLKKWKTAQKDLDLAKESGDIKLMSDAENRLKEAQDDVTKGLGSIKNGFEVFASLGNSAISIIKDLAEGFGITFGEDTQRILDNVGKAFGIISAALGVLSIAQEAAAITGATLMATLWPLLAVAAALAVAFTLFGNKNAKIDKELKESQTRVKNLENAYKDLDRAVSNAMGDAEIGAKRAAIASKQLQLIELQRQLALEKSRSDKKRDEDKIADLEGQIIDLKNSISDTTNSIVTDLLGISSTKDAAETLVSNMIEAFKNGEDYMKSYSESFDKMIDNMIMKAIVSEVIGTKIDDLMNTLQTRIDSRTTKEKQALDTATKNISLTESDIVTSLLASGDTSILFNKEERAKKVKEQRALYQKQYQDALAAYNAAAAVTPEDVNVAKTLIGDWKDGVKTSIEQRLDLFGIKPGESQTSNLSGLQQGIQNISEETGGAIEGYMNNISGQMYLQTSQMATLLNNSSQGLGVMSQMLLQMQQSYLVQSAIQGILNGWSNNSGRAVKVEII